MGRVAAFLAGVLVALAAQTLARGPIETLGEIIADYTGLQWIALTGSKSGEMVCLRRGEDERKLDRIILRLADKARAVCS